MGRWQDCLDADQRLASRRLTKVRFLLVSALNTAMGLTTFPILYFLATPLKIHYLIILTINQALCVTIAFFNHKRLVFRTFGNYVHEYGTFIAYHFFVFLVNLVTLPVLVESAGMNPIWAQMLFAVLVIVSSYFWLSHVTFRIKQDG